MDIQSSPIRLLGLAGSLRRESYSRAVLRGLQAALGPAFDLAIGEIDLPLYNQDLDGENAPDAIRAFRQSIRDSDGLILATPEYNHGMPGVLKNALDWASRPHGGSALIGKPFVAISSSPAFTGGVRAQAQVNETMLSAQAMPVAGPQIVIGAIGDKIRDSALADEPSLRFALTAIEALGAVCRERRVAVGKVHAEARKG